MKKLITILLTLAMCVGSMASCGGDGLAVPDEYNYDDLTQYITLGEYKGIEYEKADRTVTRHQIEAQLDELLENAMEEKRIEMGTIREDSIVNIDYVGKMDGVEFEGGAGEGYELDIANSTFIDGFAEALVGHYVGEEFDINVKFPKDYGSEDLAGKPAVFSIKVNYMVEKVLPEYNDEFVKKHTDYKTTEEYEKSIEAVLKEDLEEEATTRERTEVFEKILESTEVKEYPADELKARKDNFNNSYKNAAEASGMKLGDYISQNGMDEESFNAMVEEAAKNTVKTELVCRQIAKLEGIELGLEDYESYIDELLEAAGIDAESFEEKSGTSIEEYAEQNQLYSSLVYQKVMDKVMEYSKAK